MYMCMLFREEWNLSIVVAYGPLICGCNRERGGCLIEVQPYTVHHKGPEYVAVIMTWLLYRATTIRRFHYTK